MMLLIKCADGELHEFRGKLRMEQIDDEKNIWQIAMIQYFPTGEQKKPYATYRVPLAKGVEVDVRWMYEGLLASIAEATGALAKSGIAEIPDLGGFTLKED